MFENPLEQMVLITVIVILAGILIFSFPIVTIPTGHVGVVTRFGAVKEKTLPEGGPYLIIPLVDRVEKMNIKMLKYQTDADSASKDLQSITSAIAVNYHLNPLVLTKLYQTIGNNKMIEDVVIDPAIEESTKATTAKFTAEEIIIKRQDMRDILTKTLSEKLDGITAGGIIIEEVNVVDFQFSEEFDKSIEAKVTAEQRALEEKWNLERVKYQAQQKVEQAKAEAESITIQGETLRKNPEVLQLRYIEKWNGIMPLVLGGNQIIGLGDLLSSSSVATSINYTK